MSRRTDDLTLTQTPAKEHTAPADAAERDFRDGPDSRDRRLAYLLEDIDDGLWDWDLASGRMYVSPSWRRLLGDTDDPVEDGERIWRERGHPDDIVRMADVLQGMLDGRRDRYGDELRLRHSDGRWLWVHSRARVVERSPDGRASRIIGTISDITEARSIEEARRTVETQLRDALDQLPIAVAMVGPDGTHLHNNLACARIAGLPRSALVGLNNKALPWAIFDEAGRRVVFPDHEIFAPWATGRASRGVVLAHFPVGADEPVWTISDFVPSFAEDGTLKHVLCSFTDITVLRRIKASLARTHRFEGLAHLAGAVAHDFNNLLATVLGSAEVVGITLGDDSPARDDLERIMEAAQRGAALTHQLLNYARRQPGLPRVVDLGRQLEHLTGTLRRLLGRRVALEVRIAPEPLHVVIDPTQFEQLVSSLVVNAKEAMPDGGRVEIELDVSLYLTSADGRPMAVLRVTDDGEGIPAEVLPHIFDPMFTTRHLDMGAGLGLATCEGIVRQHGGRIAVSSRKGQGTTFEVCLPRARRLPMEVPRPQSAPPAGHTGQVLLVETDPTLSSMALGALERAGYGVQVAHAGAEAVELAAGMSALSGLIVADELPDMSGATLAGALAEDHPQMAVLFVRNSDNPAPATGSLRAGAGFIFRPFGTSELMSRMETLMSSLG